MPSAIGAGSSGVATASPVTSRQRMSEVGGDIGDGRDRATRRARRASPARRERRASSASNRSPASEVRSIPPTNAMRSSMTTIFSWWQCIGRSCASSPHATRVPDVKRVAHRPNLASGGAEERQRRPGPGEQPHRDALGHLGEEVAQHLHARRRDEARSRARSASRRDARATLHSRSRRRGGAGRPLRPPRPRPRCPGRGGGSPAAQPPTGPSSAASWPWRRSRRRWCATTACSTAFPRFRSTTKSARLTPTNHDIPVAGAAYALQYAGGAFAQLVSPATAPAYRGGYGEWGRWESNPDQQIKSLQPDLRATPPGAAQLYRRTARRPPRVSTI